LTILSRGNPEEMVLQNSCKSPHGAGGPAKENNKCDETKGGPCGACHPEPSNAS
jgi:hypothetical protein